MISVKVRAQIIRLVIAQVLFAAGFLVAQAPVVTAASGSIAQGFRADTSQGAIVTGALVSLKTGTSGSVELATTGSANRLAGVVDGSPLVAISDGGQETRVVLSGTTNVLVSDINGAVKAGAKITVSPIAGIGMLASADSQIVGTAQGPLETATSQTRTLTDRNGKSRTVHIGRVPLQVGIASYRAPGSDFLPPFIQNLANGVAGRPVSLIRVLLSGVLLLFGFVAVAMLVYTSVRSSITSLGRNPLAAGVIRKSLYQLAGLTGAVLVGALLASYLILVT